METLHKRDYCDARYMNLSKFKLKIKNGNGLYDCSLMDGE